jgi:hypothetical protein
MWRFQGGYKRWQSWYHGWKLRCDSDGYVRCNNRDEEFHIHSAIADAASRSWGASSLIVAVDPSNYPAHYQKGVKVISS